jgi:hypothetical protein
MNWFRENRWLGIFLAAFGLALLLALYFLFHARSEFKDASAQFNDAAAERSRLEHLDPFPNEENYRKLQEHLANYGAALGKLKDELKTKALPISPLAPNEFQSRLRQTIVDTNERAHGNRVKLPDNFHLGFDEFTAALPNTSAAPLLGQELAQIELLMNILIDDRVDSVTLLKRTPLPEEITATPTPGPMSSIQTAGETEIERGIVDLTFVAAPSSARKVLNQIAGFDHQFLIVRTLRVHSEQEKGPSREQNAAMTSSAPAPTAAIKFIVGNEHVETTMRIELVRFNF